MDVSGDLLVINDGIFGTLLQSVKDNVLLNQKSDTLYFVLETLGGSADMGYRIMKLLDSRYKYIYVVVPDRAMSAGTLMALGSDKIYMYHSSCLGPLDLQIEHPIDGSYISALDVRDTWTTISSISRAIARATHTTGVESQGLKAADAAKIANEFAANIVKPISDKIDPYHLHKSYRSSVVGAKYASNLLGSRMMKGKPQLADTVGRILADDYETHSYAITLDEARGKLHLNVDDILNLDLWPQIEAIYISVKRGVQFNQITKPKNKAKKMTAKKSNRGSV